MILGIGIDLVDIRRIEQMLSDAFIARIFTADEQRYCNGKKERASAYAKRYAAKEAAAKALGTGIGEHGKFIEMEVSNDERGKPHLTLHGGAMARLKFITPMGYSNKVFLALSDEFPYATAQVIIEAVKHE